MRLPLHLDDPLEQLAAVQERTRELKRCEAALAIDTIMQAAEWLPVPFLAAGARLAGGPANMIVTNVPGPQFPLYSMGARLLGLYPAVPLLPGSGLGVALFSYEGKLCWGFNGDYDLVPDLPAYVEDVTDAFERLRGAAVSEFMARRTSEVEIPVTEPSRSADEPQRESEAPVAAGIQDAVSAWSRTTGNRSPTQPAARPRRSQVTTTPRFLSSSSPRRSST